MLLVKRDRGISATSPLCILVHKVPLRHEPVSGVNIIRFEGKNFKWFSNLHQRRFCKLIWPQRW